MIYSPPGVYRIWLWVYYTKIPLYPIFYLLKGDYRVYPASLAYPFFWGCYGLAVRNLNILLGKHCPSLFRTSGAKGDEATVYQLLHDPLSSLPSSPWKTIRASMCQYVGSSLVGPSFFELVGPCHYLRVISPMLGSVFRWS